MNRKEVIKIVKSNAPIQATVQDVCNPNTPHCYVVCRATGVRGTITVAEEAWAGRLPEKRDSVLLSDLRRKDRGWRALAGRLITPEDEE